MLQNTCATLSWMIVIVLCSIMNHTWALETDGAKPIQIQANQATMNQKTLVSIFNGNVIITKGSLIVHADQGIAHQDNQSNKYLVLEGKPVTFVQQQDDGSYINGQCDKFEYSSKTNIALLRGRARITQGKNEVIGDTISYNTKTQVYRAAANLANGINSSTRQGRVTLILDQAATNGKTTKR